LKIIAIMISYSRRVGRGEMSTYVYVGSAGAVLASLLLGFAVQLAYGELEGASEQLFEGGASLTAVVVLTYMIFWMARRSAGIRGELEERMGAAMTRGELYGVSLLAFVSVFREGLETVLFLTSTFLLDPPGALLGAALGASSILAVMVLLVRGVYRLDLGRFFRVTSVLLIVFAAGLAGYGTHELMEAGEGLGVEFGSLGKHAYDINPPRNQDGSYPPLHENGAVGSVFKALVGYDGNPEWLRVIVYLGYWATVGSYVLRTYRNGREVPPTTADP